MARIRLDDERGRGKHGGEVTGHTWRPYRVNAAGEHEHWGAQCGNPGASRDRVECAIGVETAGSGLARLRLSRGPVGLGNAIPAAVEEGGDRPPVVSGFSAPVKCG